jgi:hypothetical protein
MTKSDKLHAIKKVRPALEAVGLCCEFSTDDLEQVNSITVWHPKFDKNAGAVWVWLANVANNKETAETILENVILELRRNAREIDIPM